MSLMEAMISLKNDLLPYNGYDRNKRQI